MNAALEKGDPLAVTLVLFAACVAVVVLALWGFEEFHAWQDRMYERAQMPHPGMDVAPNAREQWPRDMMMMDETTPAMLGVHGRADDNNRRD